SSWTRRRREDDPSRPGDRAVRRGGAVLGSGATAHPATDPRRGGPVRHPDLVGAPAPRGEGRVGGHGGGRRLARSDRHLHRGRPVLSHHAVRRRLMLLAVFVYAIGSARTDDTTLFFHPVYLLLASGVSASFVTGDLFNLFVAFEMTLVCSCVLITLGGSTPPARHGTTSVVIRALASTLFVTAVG